MDKKSKALVVAILLAVVAVIWVSSYLIGEERDAKSEFSGDFTPEVKWEVRQIGNNSALLHLTIELPPDKRNLKAEVRSIEDSFYIECLRIKTDENPFFVQSEKGLEKYLTVPSGKVLTVRIKMTVMVDESKSWWAPSLKDKTIEVKT